jgi:hypothetical protein
MQYLQFYRLLKALTEVHLHIWRISALLSKCTSSTLLHTNKTTKYCIKLKKWKIYKTILKLQRFILYCSILISTFNTGLNFLQKYLFHDSGLILWK